MNIIINVNEEVIKRKHISYGILENHEQITLFEIQEVSYVHPDSEGQALITRIEDHDISTYKKIDKKASPLLLLKNALENIDIIYERDSSKTVIK